MLKGGFLLIADYHGTWGRISSTRRLAVSALSSPQIRVDLLHRGNALKHGALIGGRPTANEAVQRITNLRRRLRVSQSGAPAQDLDGGPIEGNPLLASQHPNPPQLRVLAAAAGARLPR